MKIEIQHVPHYKHLHLNTKRVLSSLNNKDEQGFESEMKYKIWKTDLLQESFISAVARNSNKKIVGWVFAERRPSECKEAGYDVGVYVRPEFRRKGIGTELMKFLQDKLRKKLWCSPWDERSELFFEKLGVRYYNS